MAVSSNRITVGVTPTLLFSATVKTQIVIKMDVSGSGGAFLGGPAVSPATGFQIYDRDKVKLALGVGDAVYAVASPAGGSIVDILVVE